MMKLSLLTILLIGIFPFALSHREIFLYDEYTHDYYNKTVNGRGGGVKPRRRLTSDEEEIAALQVWMDKQIKNRNEIVGLSAFIVGGKGPIQKVFSGQAVVKSAWDARKKRGVTNEARDVSADTTCMLASTSKPLTWTALSMLLDAGKFNLDDPIEDALSFQVRNPSFQDTLITYRHIYTHTMGLKGRYTHFFCFLSFTTFPILLANHTNFHDDILIHR